MRVNSCFQDRVLCRIIQADFHFILLIIVPRMVRLITVSTLACLAIAGVLAISSRINFKATPDAADLKVTQGAETSEAQPASSHQSEMASKRSSDAESLKSNGLRKSHLPAETVVLLAQSPSPVDRLSAVRELSRCAELPAFARRLSGIPISSDLGPSVQATQLHAKEIDALCATLPSGLVAGRRNMLEKLLTEGLQPEPAVVREYYNMGPPGGWEDSLSRPSDLLVVEWHRRASSLLEGSALLGDRESIALLAHIHSDAGHPILRSEAKALMYMIVFANSAAATEKRSASAERLLRQSIEAFVHAEGREKLSSVEVEARAFLLKCCTAK